MGGDSLNQEKLPFLFAPAVKQDLLSAEASVSNPERRVNKLSKSQRKKLFNNLFIAAFAIPFCMVMATPALRSISEVFLDQSMFSESEVGGDFDPSLGENVSSKNHRALVIVHEGFQIETQPDKYFIDSEYQQYLRRIKPKENLYYQNDDVVVIVVNKLALMKGEAELIPMPNTLYLITESNTGIPSFGFVYDGKSYSQGISVWDQLNQIGVEEIEIGGELRHGCATQIQEQAIESGLRTTWCEDCVFPRVELGEVDDFPVSIYPNNLNE